MPSLVHSLASIEARDEDAGSSTLSTGAIVGVAIAGAFIVFAALSLLLILVARRQSRLRRLVEQAESGTTGPPSQNDSEEKSSFPRRLRKKSILDAEGSPEPIPDWHRISLPIIPLSSPDARRSERERGRELREIRRKSSWIDEDALHGPRISKPRSKHSLLSLRRKLSFRQPSSSSAMLGSPTLPHAEHKPNPGPSPTEGNGTAQTAALTRSSSSGTVLYGPRPVPQALTVTQPNPPASQEPLVATQTARDTSKIVFEAAHPNPQRPIRNCTSATGLSDILQLTAARLQDGNMSYRRQTMFAEITARKSQQLVRFEGVHITDSDAASPARSQKSAPQVVELEATETSPQKVSALGPLQKPNHDRHVSHVSQFSIVSEADSLVVSNRNSQPDVQTALSSPSRHERAKEQAQAEQAQELRPTTSGSDSSSLSTLYSVDEEAEALQTRGAVIEHIVDAPTSQQSHERYDRSPKFPSESGGSPRMGRLRRGTLGQFHGPRPMPRPESRPESPAMPASPRVRTDKPLETSLHFSIYTVEDDPFIAEPSPSQDSPRLSDVFKVLPGNVKRPETGSKSRDSIRIIDYKPAVRVTKAMGTPTPSTKSLRITLPPPYVLRPGSPTQDAIDRRPSPTLSSRSVGSSANGSSSNGDRNSVAGGMCHSTTTLLTIPSPEGSPTKSDDRPGSRTGFHCDLLTATDDEMDDEERDLPSFKNNKNMSRSRLFDQQRLPSDSSVYSQDVEGEEEDRLPPLRNAGIRDSAQIASVVAELRRMNSQISQVSGYSMASTASSNTLAATAIPEEIGSPTLPALRGGGFSPGKKGGPSGASRNYLAVGSPGKRSRDDVRERRRGSGGGGNGGVSARRSRRGTVGAGMGSGTGLADRLQELDRHMAGLSREASAKRSGRNSASSESLYDENGFLKSSPVGRD
ncbi:hypothetical protein PG988_015279 [Apiospora saccharicola]